MSISRATSLTKNRSNTQPYGEETSVADVTTLEIDWISGAVRIESYDGAEVRFSDNYNGEDTYQTVWSFADGVLEIDSSDLTLEPPACRERPPS